MLMLKVALSFSLLLFTCNQGGAQSASEVLPRATSTHIWGQTSPVEARRRVPVEANSLNLIRPFGSQSPTQREGWPPAGWAPSVFAAFGQALATGKPMAVLFRDGGCQWCPALEDVFRRDTRFVAFWPRAVFVVADLVANATDQNVSKLVQDLGVDRVPMLVVLDATPDAIVERGRIVGHYPADRYLVLLDALLGSAPKPVAGGAPTSPQVQTPPWAAPTTWKREIGPALLEAWTSGKPLLLVMTRENCPRCIEMITAFRSDPSLKGLESTAVVMDIRADSTFGAGFNDDMHYPGAMVLRIVPLTHGFVRVQPCR